MQNFLSVFFCLLLVYHVVSSSNKICLIMRLTRYMLLIVVFAILSTKSIVAEELNPIVLQTVARNYDDPTLDEYQKCFESSVTCKQACENADDRDLCEKDCPVCPILIKQQVLVQGVNDSLYQPPISTSTNTTNVIRVVNEIHNIIKQQSNVTVEIPNVPSFESSAASIMHLNISQSNPGAFGLGENVNGSCCIVIRPSKNCELQKLSNNLQCHTKRRMVCGSKCTARVMYAKSVLHCRIEADGNELCARRIEYVPFEERKFDMTEPQCYYIPRYPYVSCVKERPSADVCRRCLQLPYGYVLLKGLPPACIYCLSESPFFAGYNEFDLYTLRQKTGAHADWEQNVPVAQEDFSSMFNDIPFDFDANMNNQRRRRRQN